MLRNYVEVVNYTLVSNIGRGFHQILHGFLHSCTVPVIPFDDRLLKVADRVSAAFLRVSRGREANRRSIRTWQETARP